MFNTKRERIKYIKSPNNWLTVEFTKYVCVKQLKDTPIYRIYAHDVKGNSVYLGMFMTDGKMLLSNKPMNNKDLLNYLTYVEEEIL